jgi:hypothetical protein
MNQRCVAASCIVDHSADAQEGSNGGNMGALKSSRRRKRGSDFGQ